MEDEIYFEITDGVDIIKVEPLQWSNSNADNDWDRNWILSRVTVKGGAFNGHFSCELLSSDFELFKRELKKAYDNLKLTATFKTISVSAESPARDSAGSTHDERTIRVSMQREVFKKEVHRNAESPSGDSAKTL